MIQAHTAFFIKGRITPEAFGPQVVRGLDQWILCAQGERLTS